MGCDCVPKTLLALAILVLLLLYVIFQFGRLEQKVERLLVAPAAP